MPFWQPDLVGGLHRRLQEFFRGHGGKARDLVLRQETAKIVHLDAQPGDRIRHLLHRRCFAVEVPDASLSLFEAPVDHDCASLGSTFKLELDESFGLTGHDEG